MVWLPPHRPNCQRRLSVGPYPAVGGAAARMTQPVERAIGLDHQQLYILFERCSWDQAPIDILAKVTHGCISATTVSKRGPFERNNNV
jgi:hypothetical protein